MYLYSEGGDVFFLELTSQMSLHEGSFTNTTVSNEHKFEFNSLLSSFHFLKQIQRLVYQKMVNGKSTYDF